MTLSSIQVQAIIDQAFAFSGLTQTQLNAIGNVFSGDNPYAVQFNQMMAEGGSVGPGQGAIFYGSSSQYGFDGHRLEVDWRLRAGLSD